jgi:hypothetical protein
MQWYLRFALVRLVQIVAYVSFLSREERSILAVACPRQC